MILSLSQQWLGSACIVELLLLHHIQSVADVAMETNACNLLQGKKPHKGSEVTMATRSSFLL
jgi:hypothetical protein